MNKNKPNNTYLESSYKLVRLLDARKKVWIDLLDAQYNIGTGKDKARLQHKMDLKETLAILNSRINSVEKNLEKTNRQANQCGIDIPFEKLAKDYTLAVEEKYILMQIFYHSNFDRRYELTGRDLLYTLGYKPSQFIAKSVFLENLIKKDLIENSSRYSSSAATLLDIDYNLTAKSIRALTGTRTILINEFTEESAEDPYNRRRREPILTTRDACISFNQIVLDQTKMREIDKMLFQIEKGNQLFNKWGFEQTIKYGRAMTMLFYGAPGTGKTATSEAIANKLGKKIAIVRYARMMNMWLGNSEKNLVKIFEEAAKEKCVLVFDEAESLFGQRLNEFYSTDRLHNYMTGILMQELERYDGVCILTTNRKIIIDEAFLRRILLKLEFNIPDATERTKIWRALIPKTTPLASDVDFHFLGEHYSLSGGEIKNVIVNAIRECGFLDVNELSMAILKSYAEKESKTAVKETKKTVGFVHTN